ncbi:MAG: type IV pilus twitching motility protein PilT [Planctomycetota bacterium]
MITMEELLALLVRQGGSDLHISVGTPPRIRIDGELLPVEHAPMSPEESRRLATSVLTSDQIAKLDRDLELDCSFGLEGSGRFRANVFYQRGSVGAVMRAIPHEVPDFDRLGLPKSVCERICNTHSGLVLVTGVTGSGKSTTLAAMIDYINKNQAGHIVTIEDPVEFTHRHQRCLVTQREVGADTKGFTNALRSVLRQDPDYVLVGEMRDHETIEAALTLAETGHLTFGTLHTSDAVQTVNRIIDVFPSHQQAQVRTQLSFTLEAVFCQQLLPLQSGRGRAMAAEIMLATPAIRALIRDGKGHQIYSNIQTGGKLQMKTMSQSLAELVRSGKVNVATAEHYISDPSELRTLVRAA